MTKEAKTNNKPNPWVSFFALAGCIGIAVLATEHEKKPKKG